VSLVIVKELLCSYGIALEPAEPVAGECEPGLVERVDSGPAAALVAQDSGGLQRLKVSGRRRPGMGEQGGYRAGAHLAAGEIEADQDPAPGGVGEGGEDGFIGIGHEPYLA
jgi:hypothetical protein